MKYPFLTDESGNYLNAPATLSMNRAITAYTRLAGNAVLSLVRLTREYSESIDASANLL